MTTRERVQGLQDYIRGGRIIDAMREFYAPDVRMQENASPPTVGLEPNIEREKQFLFASQEGRYLWHVNEALRRLYGTPEKFGHCHQCGQEINFERLDALPHARLCITCKEKEEDGKRR